MTRQTSSPTAQPHATAAHRPIHSGMVLTGLCLAILLSQLGTNIINVALPTLVKSLGVDFGAVQWVVVSYLLVVTALIVGVGRFGDQLGKKRLYLWGLAVFMATLVLGPFFLSKALGLDTRMVGLVMTIGPLAAAIMGVPAGTLADRIGPRRAMVIGLALFAIGAFTMSWVSRDGGVAIYIVAILFISIGLAFFQTPNNTAVMTDARPEQRGLVSGLLALARNLGLITGASLMGALFASVAGDTAAATPDLVTDAMRFAFRIAASMAAAAFLLSLTTLRGRGA